MLAASEPGAPAGPGVNDATVNPAAVLGLTMGAASAAGRDKLTLILPPALEPLGLWVEQLVAESTGKQGKGVIPIAGEPLGPPALYGSDRFFVRMRQRGSDPEEMRDLKAAGMPVTEIDLLEPSALGAEFVRWEIATALAGALLEINPFDEPNVAQAKDATRVLLDSYVKTGSLPAMAPDHVEPGGASLTLSARASAAVESKSPEAFLTLLQDGDYFGLLAYLGPDPEMAARLHALRVAVRDRTRAATMFGYGPRYLHSTGQLHKGGPNSGVFLLITAEPREDLPIPGQPFSFGTLELAQGLGDFASLDKAGRRALHVHLPTPDHRLLGQIADVLLDRLPQRPA
jgi:transaldolase/glucose-6-phosphate isomerase